MSGFQDIAAALGIADVALRSFCKIYEFVRDLRDAPETISRLCAELYELDRCLKALWSIESIDHHTFESLKRIDLHSVLNRCGTTCARLQEDLCRWSRAGRETLYTRFRIRFNKRRIEGVTSDISVAKQTLTLAVTISIHIRQGRLLTTMADKQQPSAAVCGEGQKRRKSAAATGSVSQNINAKHHQDGQAKPKPADEASLSEAEVVKAEESSFATVTQVLGDNKFISSQGVRVGSDKPVHNQVVGKNYFENSPGVTLGLWK